MSALRQEAEGSSIEGVRVFVREYLRYRLGKWEQVRSHYRNWPRF
jgi:hypothetical protein